MPMNRSPSETSLSKETVIVPNRIFLLLAKIWILMFDLVASACLAFKYAFMC